LEIHVNICTSQSNKAIFKKNLEYINKSYYFLNAFVGYFKTILQNAWSNHQDLDFSSPGIEIGYWLDGPGIKFQWGQEFLYPTRPALGPTQPPIQWVPSLSQGQNKQGMALTVLLLPLLVLHGLF
jgi:hypothetical protein